MYQINADKLLENDEDKVTLDTVRDLIDEFAEQSRKFFENTNLNKRICITLLIWPLRRLRSVVLVNAFV